MTRKFQKDLLNVHVYDDAESMGLAAATNVANLLNQTINKKGRAFLILATGALKFLFLKYLQQQSIAWDNITVFHLDEYIGLSEAHPASFRKYLKDRILDRVKPHKVHFLHGDADDSEAEALRYENLLKGNPIDVACIGVGENGHIAFNDPPVADFNDPKLVKVVRLDEACRRQQLGEGWFPALDDVPQFALSLTIPAIMNSTYISCVVPDSRKATAVAQMLNGPIQTSCPASILRDHKNATLYLDNDSAFKSVRSSF